MAEEKKKEKSKWEKWREEVNKKKKEKEAFGKIVEERNLAERRRAFEKESLKVAKERGTALARRKSIRDLIAERVEGKIRAKASGTPIRRAPVRRVVRRRAPVRRVVRRRAPIRRAPVRRVVRRRAPIRRAPVRRVVRRRAPIRRAPTKPALKPLGISDFI